MGTTIKAFSFIIIALMMTTCEEKEERPSHFDSAISMLHSENHFERIGGASILCEIAWTGTPSERKAATAALIDGLNDELPEVRSTAGLALGQYIFAAREEWRIYLNETIPPLLDALQDESPEVREMAAYALTFIGPVGKAAIPALIKALEDDSIRVAERAAQALGYMGPIAADAIPKLVELADDENNRISRYFLTNAIKLIVGD